MAKKDWATGESVTPEKLNALGQSIDDAAAGLGGRVAKVLTAGSVYGTADVTYPISSGTTNPNSLPYRDAGGTFRVGEPTHPAHPVTRLYADNLANQLAVSNGNWALDATVNDAAVWSGLTANWSLSTERALSGTQSIKFVRDGSAFSPLPIVRTPSGGSARMIVRQGDTISMSAWVYLPAAISAGNLYFNVSLLDSSGVNSAFTLNSANTSNSSVPAGAWTEVAATVVVPAGYDIALIRFSPTTGTTVGAVFYVDNFLVFRSDKNKADKIYVDLKIREQIRPGGYIANSYYYCDYSKTVISAFSADRLRMAPFIITHPVPVSHLFIDVTTAAAGSNMLAAIYDDDGNGKPLNRRCFSSLSTAATGIIEGSVGTTVVLQPGLHWAGGVMRGTNVPSLRSVTDPSLKIQLPSPGNPGVLPTPGDVPQHWALATVSGDPPTVLGSGLFTANTSVPRIGFKVAA